MLDQDQLSDNELMRLVQKRNLDALKELYARYEQLLFSVAMKVLSNRQEAEETVQDVWLKVWNKSELFDIRKSTKFSSWIIQICHHTAIDKLKKRNVNCHVGIENIENLPDRSINLESKFELQTLKFCVKHAMKKLPEEQREIIELIYFEDLTHREIARRMGIPLGTVKSRARLAMAKLKKLVDGEGGECRCGTVRVDLKNCLSR